MDWEQLQQPKVLATAGIGLLALFLLLRAVTPNTSELKDLLKSTDNRIVGIERILSELKKQLDSPFAGVGDSSEELDNDIFALRDAEKLFADLGDRSNAKALAEAVATIDLWITSPEESKALQEFKGAKIAELRMLVKKEVDELCKKALSASDGTAATKHHAEASQILAYFPMDTTQTIIDEARELSTKLAQVGVKIDLLRRQRYNAWAINQISTTLDELAKSSSFTTSDNPKIMSQVNASLGPIDPMLLEPVVLQLYSTALEQAKSCLSTQQGIELGTRLINSSSQRKGYGDF